jgi:hypothetical protein
MTVGNRLLAVLTLCALPLLAVPWLVGWVAPLSFDFEGTPDPALAVEQEDKRSEAMDAERAPVLRRIRATDQIVQDLIDGRLTLAEAGRRLRAEQDGNPGFWIVVRRDQPGDSDEERVYRHLLTLVSEGLPNEPARAGAVRQRLEAELRALLPRPAPRPRAVRINGHVR